MIGMHSALRIALALAAVAAAPHEHAVAGGQVRYIDGLFVASKGGVVELIAYAEEMNRGTLRMQQGSLEDVPVVHELTRLMSSIPLWPPVGVIVASEAIFHDDRAERRRLAIAGQKVNVYAVEIRVADLERRDRIESLLKSVKASYDSPGYAFIILASGDYHRYYPIRLTARE
jgi:hypothetical protein